MTRQGTWQRDERTIVYLSERRARYASVTKTSKGRLITLFSKQTEEQEKEGKGDLLLVRASDDGRCWSETKIVYECVVGEPRAYGTLTTLSSGKIVAPFAELNAGSGDSRVRILSCDDGGSVFRVSDTIPIDPLYWAAPYGRLFELDGSLLMSVFGCLSREDLVETRHVCGMLRSSDDGATWHDWSPIASDPGGELSFEFSAVTPLRNATLVAIFTARRLKRGIDAPQVLMRSWSKDGGRTWTEPEQLCVGSWPGIAVVDKDTAICAYTTWCGWGQMMLLISNDGFRTFNQDLVFMEHGWLPIPKHYPRTPLYPDKDLELESIGPGSYRPFWAYNPVPLPPVVPHLDGDWEMGYYGFPSILSLSGDRLMVVLGNRQKGSAYTDPPREQNLPIELERIEAITFDRLAAPDEPRIRHKTTEYRWEIAESWTPEQWQERVKIPPAGEGKMLKSGRRIKYQSQEISEYSHVNSISGKARGYWIHRSEVHIVVPEAHWMYSDDQGRTWVKAKSEDPCPLARCSIQSGQIFEEADGTIVAPYYGYMNDEDMVNHVYGACICRSRDGGETWGDWSVLGYDSAEKHFSYCEPTLLPVSEHMWVAFMRTETANSIPWMGAMMTRAVSTDRGYTWSEPGVCIYGSQPALVDLPDGGLALIIRSTGRQSSGVYFSYDKGASWDYALAGPYNTSDAGMLDQNSFWVYAGNEVVIYRKRVKS